MKRMKILGTILAILFCCQIKAYDSELNLTEEFDILHTDSNGKGSIGPTDGQNGAELLASNPAQYCAHKCGDQIDLATLMKIAGGKNITVKLSDDNKIRVEFPIKFNKCFKPEVVVEVKDNNIYLKVMNLYFEKDKKKYPATMSVDEKFKKCIKDKKEPIGQEDIFYTPAQNERLSMLDADTKLELSSAQLKSKLDRARTIRAFYLSPKHLSNSDKYPGERKLSGDELKKYEYKGECQITENLGEEKDKKIEMLVLNFSMEDELKKMKERLDKDKNCAECSSAKEIFEKAMNIDPNKDLGNVTELKSLLDQIITSSAVKSVTDYETKMNAKLKDMEDVIGEIVKEGNNVENRDSVRSSAETLITKLEELDRELLQPMIEDLQKEQERLKKETKDSKKRDAIKERIKKLKEVIGKLDSHANLSNALKAMAKLGLTWESQRIAEFRLKSYAYKTYDKKETLDKNNERDMKKFKDWADEQAKVYKARVGEGRYSDNYAYQAAATAQRRDKVYAAYQKWNSDCSRACSSGMFGVSNSARCNTCKRNASYEQQKTQRMAGVYEKQIQSYNTQEQRFLQYEDEGMRRLEAQNGGYSSGGGINSQFGFDLYGGASDTGYDSNWQSNYGFGNTGNQSFGNQNFNGQNFNTQNYNNQNYNNQQRPQQGNMPLIPNSGTYNQPTT
ncbi:MAG: hypothetical protein WCG27_03845, partial [Pseudomonadota bacterium]